MIEEWAAEYRERYNALKHPKEDDYYLVDVFFKDELIEANLNLKAFHKLMAKKLSDGPPLILLVRNVEQDPNKRWMEFWPRDALSREGYSVELHFVRDRYAQAVLAYQEAVNVLLEEMKQKLYKTIGVEGHPNAEKCWELSCSRSRVGDLIGMAKRFMEYSLLLT